MKQGWNPLLLAAWVLCASTAMAEPDTFGLGTGRDGALTVTEPGTVINRYTQVTSPLAPGDTVLFVSSTKGFAAGDLVMVLQTTGIVPEPARGAPGPIQLSNDPVGRWELARLSFVGGQEVTLAAPLLHSYAGLVTQIIRVPEYTDVKVKSGASLVAAPWDGSRGGVLAFLASGIIHNEGELQASGAGFRGGLAGQETHDFIACAHLPAAIRPGAGRGEGISFLDFGLLATGLENASNGGGGGICPASGGGGGGNGAAGGRGGDALAYGEGVQDIGGRAGAGLVYSMLDHLTLGGGGGRGYGMGSHAQAGAGGGAIFFRGQRLTGSGSILANGTAGENAIQGGAGGGGSGGSISMRVADSAACALISARGGDGGSSSAGALEAAGPGGGGGGGRVLYQADPASACPISVEAGLAGDLIGISMGFGAGAQPTASQVSSYRGTITQLSGGFEQAAPPPCDGYAPAFSSPLPGQVVNARPTVVGYINAATVTAGVKISFGGGNTVEVNAAYGATIDGYKWWTATLSTDLTDLDEPYTITATPYCSGTGNTDGTPNTIAVVVDGKKPETVIVSRPPNLHNQDSFTFTFQATGETRAVSFKCTLDGQAEFDCGTGVGTEVVSWPVTGLSEGGHTFTVAAVDGVENRDPTSASASWTVDTNPPDTNLTGTPSSPSNGASDTFTFSTAEAGSSFECSLDSAVYAACISPKTYSGLSHGSHTFSVRAKDAAGNVDPTPPSYPWVVDREAPDTQIDQRPPNPSNSTSATFTFSATEAGSSFECSLDSAVYAACTSPKTYTGLPQGSRTFSVRAKDALGNVDATPPSYPWVVDTEAPDTAIDQKPSNPSNSSSATFTFSSTEAGSSFECSLDSAAYASCISPVTLRDLADANHTFSVKAKDAAGNVDPTPASYPWVVDTQAPDTAINQKPLDPSNNAIATFTFSAVGDAIGFECSLDSPAYVVCTSPWISPRLAEGSHTFSVRAKDAAGNVDATPASYPWVVDTVVPDTTIDQKPPNPSNSTSATFTFSATEAGSGFECSVDSAAYAGCASPMTLRDLTEGGHTFSVRAKDAAGNVDATPASYPWGVDTEAPDTVIDQKPPNPSNSARATFTFSGTGGAVGFKCSLDSAADVDCTSPWTSPPLSEGEHTFSVKARDAAGNVDPTAAEYIWSVDLTTPTAVIDEASKPRNPTNGTSVTFTFTGAGVGGRYRCKLDSQPYSDCPVNSSPDTGSQTYSDLPMRLEMYVFSVYAVDAAGNSQEQNPTIYEWQVDTEAPKTVIVSKPPNPTNSTSAMFTFEGAGLGGYYMCSIDSQEYERCGTGIRSTKEYTGLGEGEHLFRVYAVDAATNREDVPEEYPWVIVLTPPVTVITGVMEEGGRPARNPTNSTTIKFRFSGADSKDKYWCSRDGALPFAPCGGSNPETGSAGTQEYTGLGHGSHTFAVYAEDAAGNVDATPATYEWKIDLQMPATTLTNPVHPRIWRTHQPSATFRGTTEPGSEVVLRIDGLPPETKKASDNGNWELPTQHALSDGRHTASVVEAVDPVGNKWLPPGGGPLPTQWSFEFIVDMVPPETVIVSSPPKVSDSSVAPFVFDATGEGLDLQTTFECKIVAHRYSKEKEVSCIRGQAFNLATIFDIPDVKDVDGNYTLSVAARDEAGNLDPTPVPFDWTVIVDEPDAPEIISPGDGEVVYDLTPTITGKTVFSGTVEFFIGGVKAGLARADEQGSFTFRFPEPLEQTTYELTAVVTNLANNPSETSKPTTFTVVAPKPQAEAIGGGLGCAASTAQPWLALMGLVASALLSSRKRRR